MTIDRSDFIKVLQIMVTNTNEFGIHYGKGAQISDFQIWVE